MRLLALDAAGATAGVAVLDDDTVIAHGEVAGQPGLIETLPGLLQRCIATAGGGIEAVAVGLGPGSFTGLRCSIALAQGYAAAAGIPLWGVPADAAFAQALPDLGRPLWVAIRARRGRLFLLRDGKAEGFADADIPRPRGPIAIAGNAANEVAARLAAAGADVLLTNARTIDPRWTGRAGLARHRAGGPPQLAVPAYVDPPEARLPAGGLRPAPV